MICYGNEIQYFNCKTKSETHSGHMHMIETKIKKGKPVVCINPETKKVFIAVGMKIFADLMGTSKDMIKNCARKPCMYKGYYIIYLNEDDHNEILQKAIDRENA